MTDGVIQKRGGKILRVGGKIATAKACCCPIESCLTGDPEDNCTGIADVTDFDMLVDLGTAWEEKTVLLYGDFTCQCDCNDLDDNEYALAYDPGISKWSYVEEDWCPTIESTLCAVTGAVDLQITASLSCFGNDACIAAIALIFSGIGIPIAPPFDPIPWTETWWWTQQFTKLSTSWTSMIADGGNPHVAGGIPVNCPPCGHTNPNVLPTMALIIP